MESITLRKMLAGCQDLCVYLNLKPRTAGFCGRDGGYIRTET